MVLLNRITLLTSCCCSLVVFRLSKYATLRLLLLAVYHCSSCQSLFIANFGRSPLAAYSRLYAGCFLLLTVRYSQIFSCCLLSGTGCSLLAVGFLLLASCLVIFFRSSSLAVCYSLHITICMLVVIPQLTNHGSPFASVYLPLIARQSVYAVRELLLDTRFVLLVSRHLLLTFSRWKLPGFCSILLASGWSQLVTGLENVVSYCSHSLSDVCCPLAPYCFSLLGSCFSLLACIL